MPGPSRDIQLRLFRDALSTPWGFRLQGGRDIRQPLTVQKVVLGSPVDEELRQGDVILEIQNCDATPMTHQKAQEMIKSAGGSLLLRIRRSGYHDPPTARPAAPGPGLTLLPGQQGLMMYRIQDTLSNLTLGCSHGYDATMATTGHHHLYDARPPAFGHNDHLFSSHPKPHQPAPWQTTAPKHSKYPDRLYSTLPKPKKNSPQMPLGLAEPGWTPKSASAAYRHPGGVNRRPNPPPPQPTAGPTPRPRSLEPERPAWEGSLRPSTDPHLTDMRVQIESPHDGTTAGYRTSEIARFSPLSSPGQRHSGPWSPKSDTARVVNLQYNTPAALYSRTAAEEALQRKTYGKSGFGGPAQIESDVYSLVHDVDSRSRPSARNNQSSHSYQSPDVYTDF